MRNARLSQLWSKRDPVHVQKRLLTVLAVGTSMYTEISCSEAVPHLCCWTINVF